MKFLSGEGFFYLWLMFYLCSYFFVNIKYPARDYDFRGNKDSTDSFDAFLFGLGMTFGCMAILKFGELMLA